MPKKKTAADTAETSGTTKTAEPAKPTITKTVKFHINASKEQGNDFCALTSAYAEACEYVSGYVFDHEFILNANTLQGFLYQTVRERYGLKSQMAVSVLKTVVSKYKTVETQLASKPYKYIATEDGKDVTKYIPRTLEWLQEPIHFKRPQADLVHGRDYSFVDNGTALSLNTLGKRTRVAFDVPECFKGYFDGTWKFGTGKLVKLLGEWYFHIPATKEIDEAAAKPSHIVGLDRGLRFLVTAYDDTCKTTFFKGSDIMRKRQAFADTRAELQAKGTRSAKRALKRISGRENRWMSDVNHQISKTLVQSYGKGTLFVLEDLAGVSFAEENLSRSRKGRRELRSWPFYQFDQFLKYKALEAGSSVINVPAAYTSQRCPLCGRIHKENRDHKQHEYLCDGCGYRSNDDRIGAMNLYDLGIMYASGNKEPGLRLRK